MVFPQDMRIAHQDAQAVYRDVSGFKITFMACPDGWHVDYDLTDPLSAGGGPHYVIHPDTGAILSRRYEPETRSSVRSCGEQSHRRLKDTPAGQYKALLKEYQDAVEVFSKAYFAAKTAREGTDILAEADKWGKARKKKSGKKKTK